MKKIFITRNIPEKGIEMLRAKGYEIDIYPKMDPPSQKKIISLLKKKPYDAILSLLTDKIDVKIFDACKTAKIISNYAVGYNNIDIQEASKRGIIVTNTSGTSTVPVAEHVMAFILCFATRMVEADQFVRDGKFKGWSPNIFPGFDLKGKVLGIIGAGSIGSQTIHYAKTGFDMKIIYHDIKRNERIENEYGARFVSMNELFKESDYVSINVPLLESTHHLVNWSHLNMMKKSSFLINTSRGPVVNEKDLVKALYERRIAGAGLDVFEFEPKLSPGLKRLPNTILTPHIASAREATRNEMSVCAAKNIIDFFETGKTGHTINL